MTHLSQNVDLDTEQRKLITSICQAFQQDRFFQSYLLVGPGYLSTFTFIQNLIKNLFCMDACGNCKNCYLIESLQHPDYIYISNVESNIIKIDDIRSLQDKAYKSLAIAKHKIIVIHPADKLNIQAASALLKILEEPPESTVFILVAENIMSLPATIVSRCHKYFLQDRCLFSKNYLDIIEYYGKNDEKYILLSKLAEFLKKLTDLLLQKTNVCELADDFKEYKLENVLWFLYILTSMTIKTKHNQNVSVNSLVVTEFAKTQNIFSLFKQLDRIKTCLQASMNNIALNSSLCIANILLGYKKC